MFGAIKKSLSSKVLIALTFSIAAVMSAMVYLTVTHETKDMLNEVSLNSEEISSAIFAGIKYPMSVGDSGAVEKSLLEMRKVLDDVEVFICDKDQNIRFSSHEHNIGQNLKTNIGNAAVIEELQKSIKSAQQPARQEFEETVSGRKYMLHMHIIPNEEACHGCHGQDNRVLGAIILRKATDRNYAAIADVKSDNIIMSVIGVFGLVLFAHMMMVRLVTRPVEALASEARQLPEMISNGDIVSGRPVIREDEIGALQKTLNDMAVEIYEKNHAIGNSNQALTNANKELEAFAYSVSHDLRAPLRNIDGFSKILIDEYADRIDDRAKHYLTRIRSGTEKMSMLIDDMLTFSRIGRAELQFRRVKCSDIIKPIIEYYSSEIEKRNVTVTIHNLPEINCDPVLMQSLFSNLISNALKYSRQTEKPEITIGYDANKRAFFVKDNGTGFDMKYHDKIFHVFQRLHLPEEYEGTGIGLAVVKRIADRHNGVIWAESEPGMGATFFLDIPIY